MQAEDRLDDDDEDDDDDEVFSDKDQDVEDDSLGLKEMFNNEEDDGEETPTEGGDCVVRSLFPKPPHALNCLPDHRVLSRSNWPSQAHVLGRWRGAPPEEAQTW